MIDEVISLIDSDEWAKASTLLERRFEGPSICAQESPDYTVDSELGDEEHFAACHLHRY